MRLVRKIIYIGECNESAVYFDTEKNIALSAPKSHLLNTTAAGRINRWLPILVGVMVIGGGSIGFLQLLILSVVTIIMEPWCF